MMAVPREAYLRRLAEAFRSGLDRLLTEHHLAHGESYAWASPRRLAVQVEPDAGPRIVSGRDVMPAAELQPRRRETLDPPIPDRRPQRSVVVEILHHRVAAPSRVLHQHRDRNVERVERLEPALKPNIDRFVFAHAPAVHDHTLGTDQGRGFNNLSQDLARRDPHPVVRRCEVDEIGGVYVEVDLRVPKRLRVGARDRLLPRLRIRDEDLDDAGRDTR